MTKEKKTKKVKIKYNENKWINYLLVFAFAVFLIIFSTFKITGDDDLFWHLATGRYIVNTHSVPSTDVFGYMTEGQQWMPFEWGWDVLTYGVYNLFGYTGLSILRTLLLLITFGLVFYNLRKFKISYLVSISALTLLAFAVIDRLTPRPHLMSYLFFLLLLTIIFHFRYYNRGNLKVLYFIPPIFLIWANMHMGIIAGGFLMLLYFVSEVSQTFNIPDQRNSDIKPLSKNVLGKLFIVLLIAFAAIFINPNFYQTYIYAYEHTKMKMLETVNEWLSPFGTRGDGFVNNLYKILLFAGVLNLYYAVKKKDIYPAILWIGFALYSVRALRFTVDYVWITFIFTIIAISEISESIVKSEETKISIIKKPASKIILIVLLAYMIINLPSDKLYLETLKYYRVTGFGINSDFIPTDMFDFMKQNKIPDTGERIFNHFGTGGFFVWNFEGKKNFIDSRNLNDDIFFKYQNILIKKPGFEQKLDEYGIDYAIYLAPDLVRDPKEMENTIISYFCKSPNWKLLFWDDKSFLWVKNIPKFKELIDKYEYKYINPYNVVYQKNIIEKAISEDYETVKREIERKRSEKQDGIIINTVLQIYGNKLNK